MQLLPALASDTALDMALEEMALFLFMISSNSASLRGVRDASISLQIHTRVTPCVSSKVKIDMVSSQPMQTSLNNNII